MPKDAWGREIICPNNCKEGKLLARNVYTGRYMIFRCNCSDGIALGQNSEIWREVSVWSEIYQSDWTLDQGTRGIKITRQHKLGLEQIKNNAPELYEKMPDWVKDAIENKDFIKLGQPG